MKKSSAFSTPQYLAMIILGILTFVIPIALVYAVWKDLWTGLIVAGAGCLAFYIVIKWLIWLNPDNKE